MEFKSTGGGSLLLKTKKEKVLINPDTETLKKEPARVVLYTNPAGGWYSQKNDEVVMAGPGEYEVGGVNVLGISGGSGSTIYVLNTDGLEVGVVGDLKEPLTEKKTEKISGMDVLLFSGKTLKALGAKAVIALAKKWGANVLIPMGFESDEDKRKFLDEADTEGQEALESFKLEKENLPEGLEVVILK